MAKLFSEIPRLEGENITLKALTSADTEALRALTESEAVYRFLPTFLYEQKYEDKAYVIDHLYDECLKSSLILGVYRQDDFCGLAEVYGYRAPLLKASVGYRLSERCWGQGIATETLGLMVRYLLEETDIEIITASVMPENQGSAKVLKKNRFIQVAFHVLENWGYSLPTVTDKWIRTGIGYRRKYHFHE